MLPMLVGACPSFSDKWTEHKQEYFDEEGYLPYIALGDFARHLIELEKQGLEGEIKKAFAAIEKLHIEGDSYVKEAVTIGLLEGLQNNLGNDERTSLKYLKPETLKWWNELNKFWNGENKYVGQSIN